MDNIELKRAIVGSDGKDFEEIALRVFQYQYDHNEIYQQWVDRLDVKPEKVKKIEDIPMLPISLFKTYDISSTNSVEQTIFTSSGTTGSVPSRHLVYDLPFYHSITKKIFEDFYGPLSSYCVLALLPSYLERTGSSLIAMVKEFINSSDYPQSGFYLYDHASLRSTLLSLKQSSIPTLLIGVSFALLDFIEEIELDFSDLIVMETGGMKGRKKEISRSELHRRLTTGFGSENIHSEYGMTELFSQAYALKNGIFKCGPTLKVLIKEITDPLAIVDRYRSGIINCIDLANVDTCSFIETQDIGRYVGKDEFEILGRIDTSDIRGCNLMVADL